jgi:DNA-nicking Smr family endonuclease
MAHRPRDLRAEEEALWDLVAQTARKIRSDLIGAREKAPLVAPNAPSIPQKPVKHPALIKPGRVALKQFALGQSAMETRALDLNAPLSERLRAAPVAMDLKAYTKMTRGNLTPEARIDLHGMTLAQAHGVLHGFIHTAHARGQRLVLVITGKGKIGQDDGPIPRRIGALKHDVPHWLRSDPLRHMVLELREAHRKHGGSGAYYVYLRRNR